LLWVGLQQPTADDWPDSARTGYRSAAIEDALNHVERPKALRYAHYSFVTVYAAKWAGGELSPASPAS
jgi:Mg2+ and Co2+ transporter CorA